MDIFFLQKNRHRICKRLFSETKQKKKIVKKAKLDLTLIIQLKIQCICLFTSGTSCSSGVGFYGDGEHIINFMEPGCGWVRTFQIKLYPALRQRIILCRVTKISLILKEKAFVCVLALISSMCICFI